MVGKVKFALPAAEIYDSVTPK